MATEAQRRPKVQILSGVKKKKRTTDCNGKAHLRSEAEEALRLHHLLQHVALGACRAVVLVHDTVLQVDVVHRQAHVVLFAVDDGYRVQLVHHLWNEITKRDESLGFSGSLRGLWPLLPSCHKFLTVLVGEWRHSKMTRVTADWLARAAGGVSSHTESDVRVSSWMWKLTFDFTLKAFPVLLSRRLLLGSLIVLPGAFTAGVHPFDGVFLCKNEKPNSWSIQVLVSQKGFVQLLKIDFCQHKMSCWNFWTC